MLVGGKCTTFDKSKVQLLFGFALTLQRGRKYVKVHDGTKNPKIAYHVPRRDDEKLITNDKKPYILRFLERQWAVRVEEEGENRVESPKSKKKKKSDVKKRASLDMPSTSSDPKTRRLS